MRTEGVEFPGGNGLRGRQYIMREYSLSFHPTVQFVKCLNRRSDKPQGLAFSLNGFNIMVATSDEEYFAKYAETWLREAEEKVEEVETSRSVETWFS